MKANLLNLLACPKCSHEPLQITSSFRMHEEIYEGFLICTSCKTAFPIIKRVPRLLVGSFFSFLFLMYPEFFASWSPPNGFHYPSTALKTKNDAKIARTLKSFSYEWRKFSKMIGTGLSYEANFGRIVRGLDDDLSWKGNVLDVGCGAGCYLASNAKSHPQTTFVGIDLGFGVDSAYKNTHNFSNVHVVQGDLYSFPFRPSSFQIAYTIGVLQHVPNPSLAMRSIFRCLDSEGFLILNVYRKPSDSLANIFDNITDFLRLFTLRLPLPKVNRICQFLGAATHLPYEIIPDVLLAPYSRINRDSIQSSSTPSERLTNMINLWFDHLTAPVRRRYTYQEVLQWADDANCSRIKVPNGPWEGTIYCWK